MKIKPYIVLFYLSAAINGVMMSEYANSPYKYAVFSFVVFNCIISSLMYISKEHQEDKEYLYAIRNR